MDLAGAPAKRAARSIHGRLVGHRLGGELDLFHGFVELPDRCPGGIQGHRSAADDHDLFTELDAVTAIEVEQIVDRLDDAVLVGAVDREVPSAHGADGQEDGFESIFTELFETEVVGNRTVSVKCDPELFDRRNFAVDDTSWQAVFGYPVAEHPSEFGQSLEDSHVIAHERQIVGAPQTGRTAADNRHPVTAVGRSGGLIC